MEKTLFTFLVFAFCSLGLGDNCPWPNGTDKALHWWQDPNNYVTVYDTQIFDANGNPEYPVNLLGQVYIKINFTYTGPVINNLLMNDDVAEWGGFNCQWSDLPTFGLLSNLNACAEGVHCPLQPGNQIMQFYIDFNNYQLIINLLKNDTPYQNTFTFKNTDTGDKMVVYTQTRCLTQAPTSSSKN